jgi:tetratricopeptide (TPR) repeat protein
MVSLARAATDVAGRLDPSLYGFLQVADWQARAWGELANALRVADDLDEAERAFGVAFEFFRKGSEDSFLKVHLYDLHASFLGTRRQFGLAFSVLDIVLSLYLELGDRHLAGRALIKKAVYTHYSGQPDVAIQLSDQGLSLLEKGREPELSFLAAHNKIWYLVACGRFRKAKKELFLHRSDFQNLEGSINHLKLRWLQAQVGAGLNEWKSAEAALLEVSEGFEAAGMGFHAALASLDLSLLWMRLGRLREAEDLGMDAADVFLALGIHREALGCVMILRDAFEKRKATVVLLEGVIEFLRRSQIDPDARFIPRF